jgi:hypothetical protein
MKEIGRTKDSGYIVEMNQHEYGEFTQLYKAVSGSDGLPYFDYDPGRIWEFDFTNIFHAIRAYYMHKFKINEMRALVDSLDDILKNGNK